MRTLSGLPGETHPSAMVTLSTRASQCSPNSRGSLSRCVASSCLKCSYAQEMRWIHYRNSALPPTAPDANLCNRQRHHVSYPRPLYYVSNLAAEAASPVSPQASYAPQINGAGAQEKFQSISCLPPYSKHSFEVGVAIGETSKRSSCSF